MYKRTALFLLAFHSGCTALTQGDADKLRDDYVENTRKLGLEPVYPPSEEFQVGDVYFVSHPSGAPDDIDNRAMIYLGTVPDVRTSANSYLASRINFGDTKLSNTNLALAQPDFQRGAVATNSATRTSLPLVSYPSISGSASSAAAFGGFAFGNSSAFGLGQSESVSIDFGDTRAYGMPVGAVGILNKNFVRQYSGTVCRNQGIVLKQARNRAYLNIKRRQELKKTPALQNVDALCGHGRDCQIRITTRTLSTRQIDYAYTGASVANLAAAQARGAMSDNSQSTLAVPNPVDLSVTIGEETKPAQIQALVKALDVIPASGATATQSNALQFVGFQGNAARFMRKFQKPVAIAYEAVLYNFDGDAPSCGLKIDPESGELTNV